MNALAAAVEDEAKFTVPPGFELPDLSDVLRGAVVVGMPGQSFETVYYDTRDLRLLRWGISLRCRVGERRLRKGWGRWTVKLPEGTRGPSVIRRELVVDASATSVPEEVASLVRAYVRSAPVTPVARLRSERTRHLIRVDDRDVAEIDDDEVSVLEDGRVAYRFRELEIERLDGAPVKVMKRVVKAMRAVGASATDGTSKVAHALGPDVVGEPEVVAPHIDSSSTMGEVARAAIASSTTKLLQHDPGLRMGGDPEDVHQARVATRRLRSDLHTFGGVLDHDAISPVRDELKWLGGVLGANRDADVLLERLRRQSKHLSADDQRGATAVIRALESEREAARDVLLRALDSDRYIALLDVLVRISRRPPLVDGSEAPASEALSAVVDRQWKRLAKTVKALGPDPDDDALHQVRIRAKRTRYAAEASIEVCGARAKRLAKAVAALQGVLGELNDAVVAEAWLRGTARRSAPQAFAAGVLVSMQREDRRAGRAGWRAAWDDALEARRRWRS